jgi:hypothetical protein
MDYWTGVPHDQESRLAGTIRQSRTRSARWLAVLRRYMMAIAGLNLVWEFAHVPLYTIWETGRWGEVVFAAVHCTGGDILIALSALVVALFTVGTSDWPRRNYWKVAAAAIVIGLGYTIFSEWLNIEVREAWAYRDAMPVVPLLGAGLTPMLQWIIIPAISFWWARKGV